MADAGITLYHYPGACSLVTVCALEMSGLAYTLKLVDLGKGEHLGPAYLAVSPLGKVPYMTIDGEGLAENAALITYLASERPDSGIFPKIGSSRDRAEIVGGLSFCSGTLHPIVRGMFNPARLTTGEIDGVREMAFTLGEKSFGYAEKRLEARGGHWLGEPSIIDVYLYWAFGVATKAGFDTQPFPCLSALSERLKASHAFIRMLEEEERSRQALGA